LAAFADGTVLLDLTTGGYYRLNASAAGIAERLIGGNSAEATAAWLARSYGIDPETARRDVAALLAELETPSAANSANPFHFVQEPGGFLLHWQGQPVCALDPEGRFVHSRTAPGPDTPTPAERLQWAAPHVLLLQGTLMLHAAAVRLGDGVVAFCGGSGIGKTTTAHQFRACGCELIAEDLVVLALDGPTPEVAVHGEPTIRRWVAEQSSVLTEERHTVTEGLRQVTAGPRLALRAVHFLSRTSMAEPRIICKPLGHAAGLVLLLANSFAELGRADLWAKVWEGSLKIVRGTALSRARVPDGLDRLAQAVADYTRTVN
jgi:hypothetical protein